MKLSERRLNAALYRIECGTNQHKNDATYVAMAYRQLEEEKDALRKLAHDYITAYEKLAFGDALLANTQENG